MKVPEATTHEIVTVRQLVEAVRPDGSGGGRGDGGRGVEHAAARPAAARPIPVLGRLLAPRRLLVPLLWLVARVLPPGCSRGCACEGLEHLPASGPVSCICPNHQGYLDPFLLCGVLPYRVFRQLFVVGAAEYFQTPLMAWVARQINLVPVDPDASLVPAMKAGAFGLTHGKVLLLFPEGERSIDGTREALQEGRADPGPAPRRADRAGGAARASTRSGRARRASTGASCGRGAATACGSRSAPPVTVRAGESYADAATRLRDAVDAMWQRLER